MSRRPILLAVMLSMLLQAAAIGGLWSVAAVPGQALHVLLDWAGLTAHPVQQVGKSPAGNETFVEQLAAATQGFQQDSSADTYYHVGVDAWLHALGLIPAEIHSIIAISAAGSHPELVAEAAPAEPVLEGLRRPPRPLG